MKLIEDIINGKNVEYILIQTINHIYIYDLPQLRIWKYCHIFPYIIQTYSINT